MVPRPLFIEADVFTQQSGKSANVGRVPNVVIATADVTNGNDGLSCKGVRNPVLGGVILPEVDQALQRGLNAFQEPVPHQRRPDGAARGPGKAHDSKLLADLPVQERLQDRGGEGGLTAAALARNGDLFFRGAVAILAVLPPSGKQCSRLTALDD
jgi:hypothetical protein